MFHTKCTLQYRMVGGLESNQHTSTYNNTHKHTFTLYNTNMTHTRKEETCSVYERRILNDVYMFIYNETEE